MESKTRQNGQSAKKKAARSRKATFTITVEQYNTMWSEYVEHQSLQRCADAAKVSYNTARRYILGEGQPDMGFVPIRKRYLQSMAEAQAQQEKTLADFQAEQLKGVNHIINLHTAELALLSRDVKQRLARFEVELQSNPLASPQVTVSLDRLTQSYERMVRLGERLMGGSDVTVEHRENQMFRNWTDEERIAYATKGVLPESER